MLKALPYLLVMAAVVPLAGFVVTGSWRAALRYSATWLKCVAVMALAGGLLVMCVNP
jgi:hypothetical protein